MQTSNLSSVVSTTQASENTKIHLLYGYYHIGLSKQSLSIIFRKSIRTIEYWISRWEEFKSTARLCSTVYSRKFNQDKKDFIMRHFSDHPCSFLDEARYKYMREYHQSISISTIWRIIHDAGLTRKVIERRAMQICCQDIIRFYDDLNSLPMNWTYQNLIFLDEVGFDNRDMFRKRGYALKGSRIVVRAEFTRGKRCSLLCFLGINGIEATYSTEGTFDRHKFLSHCSDFATSEKVREYPGKHSVWILDGASIHCDKNISHYLRSLGIYTIYLPAYCPFYNPIEIVFGNIKSHLQRNYIENISFAEMNIFVAQTLIDFMSKSARKIFSKCGYVRSGFFDPVKAFKQDIKTFGY
jgi:transposase